MHWLLSFRLPRILIMASLLPSTLCIKLWLLVLGLKFKNDKDFRCTLIICNPEQAYGESQPLLIHILDLADTKSLNCFDLLFLYFVLISYVICWVKKNQIFEMAISLVFFCRFETISLISLLTHYQIPWLWESEEDFKVDHLFIWE